MRACATMASISPSRRLRSLSRSFGRQQRTPSPPGKPGQARRRPPSSNGRDSNEGALAASAMNAPLVSLPTALVFDRNRDFAPDGAVEGINQRLDLDKLVARSLGRVAHKGGGQHFRMRVPVLDHALTGLLQGFKSLAHPASPEKIVSIPRPDSLIDERGERATLNSRGRCSSASPRFWPLPPRTGPCRQHGNRLPQQRAFFPSEETQHRSRRDVRSCFRSPGSPVLPRQRLAAVSQVSMCQASTRQEALSGGSGKPDEYESCTLLLSRRERW